MVTIPTGLLLCLNLRRKQCLESLKDHVLFQAVQSLLRAGFAKNMKKKKINATKDTTETLQPSVGTAERGKESRDSYAAEHPVCEQCMAVGRYVKTAEIHHKLPLAEGGTHDRRNLIALCKECHARIHAERGDRWHKKRAARYDERL